MDKLTLKRGGRVLAPSVFTVGNMACGFYALLSAYRGEFSAAATAIILGMAFDSLDGRVARLVHGDSPFGVEFDSLSDFLTFGIAPGYMMYAFILKDYGAWGYPMAFFFALCGALRLARFNAVAHDSGGSKTHFTGLPIPAAAGLLASFVLLYVQLVEEGRPAHTWHFLMSRVPSLYGLVPAMVLTVALLMVSTIAYPAFKQPNIFRPPLKLLLGLVILAILIFVYPHNTGFLLFFAYVLVGPAGWLVKTARALFRPKPPTGAAAADVMRTMG